MPYTPTSHEPTGVVASVLALRPGRALGHADDIRVVRVALRGAAP